MGKVADEDEWELEKEAEERPKEVMEIFYLRKELVDLFYKTHLRLSATSEMRVEIVEIITQLEAKNPTLAPNKALTLLNFKWILT